MQEQSPERSPGRRATDSSDALALLKENNARLATIEMMLAEQSTAFVLNDLKRPDYDGHRKAHLTLIKASEVMDSYKQDMTKKVIGVIVTFLMGLLASGFVMQMAERIK